MWSNTLAALTKKVWFCRLYRQRIDGKEATFFSMNFLCLQHMDGWLHPYGEMRTVCWMVEKTSHVSILGVANCFNEPLYSSIHMNRWPYNTTLMDLHHISLLVANPDWHDKPIYTANIQSLYQSVILGDATAKFKRLQIKDYFSDLVPPGYHQVDYYLLFLLEDILVVLV